LELEIVRRGKKAERMDIIHLSSYKHITWRLCKNSAVVGEVVASLQIISVVGWGTNVDIVMPRA
jgi:hypothetical protein